MAHVTQVYAPEDQDVVLFRDLIPDNFNNALTLWNETYPTWYDDRIADGSLILDKSCAIMFEAIFNITSVPEEDSQVGAKWFIAPSTSDQFDVVFHDAQQQFIDSLNPPDGWTRVRLILHLIAPRLYQFSLTPRIGRASSGNPGYYNQMSLIEPAKWKINFGPCYGAGMSTQLSGLIPVDINIVPIYLRYANRDHYVYEYTTEDV